MNHGTSSLILCGYLLAFPHLATAAPTASATEEERRAAQKMFEAGDGLYESGRFDDAISAFKNSHNLVASPNSRLMLARSLREAGRTAEACEEFRGTIKDAEASGGRYPEALQAAQSELKALEAQVADAKPTTPPVEGAAAASEPPTGTATPAPAPPKNERASLAAEPPATPKSNDTALRTSAWIAAGVGVAGAGAFGVFAYLDRKTFQDLESDCKRNRCPAGSMESVDEGRRYQLLANVGLGVAVIGAAAATTLFVLSPRRESATPELALRATPAGLLLDGKF